MLQQDQRKFGRPISKADAERLYKSFIKVKQRTHDKFKESLAGDPEALRFFCGKEDSEPATDDIAYVFDKKAVEHLMAKMTEKEADGLIIFHGIRSKEDSKDDDGKFTDVDGRPTVMLFPYKYADHVAEGATEPDLLVMNEDNDGTEHPGTGGIGGGEGSRAHTGDGEPAFPVVFRSIQIQKFL